MTIITLAQRVALNHHLSDYSNKLDFDDILKAIRNEDYEKAVPWSIYKHLDVRMLIKSIIDLENEIEIIVFNKGRKS